MLNIYVVEETQITVKRDVDFGPHDEHIYLQCIGLYDLILLEMYWLDGSAVEQQCPRGYL